MTRGIRNNNPLNIRHSADQWEGARAEQTDKSFVQFESMAYGYRAAWKTLESYWKHFKALRQPMTVQAVIGRWAPPSENDTDAYVTTILRLTSLGGNELLPRPFMGIAIDKLVRLFRAMTTMECGVPYDQVSEQPIWEGYDLAFPGKRKQHLPQFSNNPSPVSPFRIETPLGEEPKQCPAYDEYWDWSPQAHWK